MALLRQLPAGHWERPTVAGAWVVRDVVAHLLDSTLRRLAFHRDGMTPPAPARALASERDFVGFINELNAQWVESAKRFSPRVLTDLYQRASGEAADWFEALPFDAPALFPVSWAGEEASAGWFDIGREFTELWHHQAQIRLAVDADAARRSTLPRGRDRRRRARTAARVPGRPGGTGETVALDIDGASGGRWTLSREATRWTLWRGEPPRRSPASG